MKQFRRSLSLLLVLLMCVSLFPVSAFAGEDADLEAETAAEEIVEEPATEEAAEETDEAAAAAAEPETPAELGTPGGGGDKF